MLQALKSVSGLGKNKSQNALSLDGQLVTDQILIKRNFHHNRANKSKQYSSFNQPPECKSFAYIQPDPDR